MQSTSAFALTSSRIQRSPTIYSYSPYPYGLSLGQFSAASRRNLFPLRKHMKNNCKSQASVYSLAPLNFRRRATRPVSYYALF